MDPRERLGPFLLLKVHRLDRQEHLGIVGVGVGAIRAGFGRFPARIEGFGLTGASFWRFSAREGGWKVRRLRDVEKTCVSLSKWVRDGWRRSVGVIWSGLEGPAGVRG